MRTGEELAQRHKGAKADGEEALDARERYELALERREEPERPEDRVYRSEEFEREIEEEWGAADEALGG